MIPLVIVWALCGFVGWKIGEGKGRAGLGLALGVLLGLIGLVIIALLRPATPRADAMYMPYTYAAVPPPPPVERTFKCPSCKAPISPAAAMCSNCGNAVQPTALLPPPAGTPAQMLRDPSGRFVNRYWDGNVWTEWVQNEPQEYLTDPPVPSRPMS